MRGIYGHHTQRERCFRVTHASDRVFDAFTELKMRAPLLGSKVSPNVDAWSQFASKNTITPLPRAVPAHLNARGSGQHISPL